MLFRRKETFPSKGSIAEVVSELTAGVETASQLTGKEGLASRGHSGRIHEITRETFVQALDALEPKMRYMHCFASAERGEPLILYFLRNGRYFCRRLTWQETIRLNDAEGLPDDIATP